MSEKIARLGIERDNDLMYFIKKGDVWATPRKRPGQPKGNPQMVASAGVDLDYSKYIYFLDRDGDVARKARASGGGGRKAKAPKAPKAPRARKSKSNGNGKANRSAITGHYVKEATAKRHPGTTVTEMRTPHVSEEQIARDCDEAIAATAPPAVAGARTKNGFWY